jgi:hypothetical protein
MLKTNFFYDMTVGRVVPYVWKDRTAVIFLDYLTLNVKALLILTEEFIIVLGSRSHWGKSTALSF